MVTTRPVALALQHPDGLYHERFFRHDGSEREVLVVVQLHHARFQFARAHARAFLHVLRVFQERFAVGARAVVGYHADGGAQHRFDYVLRLVVPRELTAYGVGVSGDEAFRLAVDERAVHIEKNVFNHYRVSVYITRI